MLEPHFVDDDEEPNTTVVAEHVIKKKIIKPVRSVEYKPCKEIEYLIKDPEFKHILELLEKVNNGAYLNNYDEWLKVVTVFKRHNK